jgi:hypothetical protein
MTVRKSLEERIHGWFPKQPNLPSNNVKAAEAPTKAFKILWYAVVLAILTLIIAAVIIFYIPFMVESFVNRTIALMVWFIALTAIIVYLTRTRDNYKRRPNYHSTVNSLLYRKYRSRAIFLISFGLATGFMLSGLVVGLLGQPLPRTYSLLLFFAFIGVGAFIGDWIGRKRNYQFPLFP